jgi:hypothetical protein
MTAAVQQLLHSFDALSEAEKREAAAEVLRRTKLEARETVKGLPIQPRDEWERRLLGIATNCGTSLSNEALSSEGLYE